MANKQMEKIRRAVCANRGGLEKATENQIMTIWNSLPADVQKQYMDSIPELTGTKKERKGDDATGDKTRSDV